MGEGRGEAIILTGCLGVSGSVGTSGKEANGSMSIQLAGNTGPFPSSSIMVDLR